MSNIVLTQTSLERQLTIYTACAVKKGALYIEQLKQGIECKELFSDATLMIGMINAIKCWDLSITSCISNEKIQIILNKLSRLCSMPCKDVINFQNTCLIWSQGGNALIDQGGRLCGDEEEVE